MDAFAVSICKGMYFFNNKYKKATIIGLYFGIFQMLMPIIGYLIGYKFHDLIVSIDHWIAFILLLIIGIKMIKNALLNENSIDNSISIKTMFSLSIATSIDALIMGLTLSLFNINIFISVSIIGIITYILSFIGVIIGQKAGEKLGVKSQILGGFILIVIGLKTLFEHLKLI